MERRCPQGRLGRVGWCWAGLGVWAKPRQGWALTAACIFLVSNLCPCLFIGNSRPWGTGGWGWPEGKLVSWVAPARVPRSHRGSGYIRIAWLLASWGWLCGNVFDSEKRWDDVNVRDNTERSIDDRFLPWSRYDGCYRPFDRRGWHLWWCHSILRPESHLNHNWVERNMTACWSGWFQGND